MWLTEALFGGVWRKWSRLPLNPKEISEIKFKELSRLELKNKVSGRGSRTADTTCLQEMAVMFACMKKNDFREAKCSNEIKIFETCYSEYTEKKKLQKEREESGHIVTGSNVRNITTKQLNDLLKKYPQHNPKR